MSENNPTPTVPPTDGTEGQEQGADASVPTPMTEGQAPVFNPDPVPQSVAVSAPPAAAPASAAPVDPATAAAALDIRAHVEELSEAVLDSADVATRSAAAAVTAGVELKAAASQLNQITDRSHKQARIMLFSAAGVMFVALVFFLFMGARMISRINQLDTMLMAVGKRVVELNAGLEALDAVNRNMDQLAQKQEAMTQASNSVQARIDETLKQAETMVQQVPAATAKQVAATGENLAKQVQGLNSRIQAQATAVQNLGTEVGALKGSVANVDKLNRDVQALITLQRERYLEALQKNNAAAVRERSVQFPRASARPVPEEGAAAVSPANAPGPVVLPKAP
jgi:DNA repair exonuclease SbcCD ATPase subunit